MLLLITENDKQINKQLNKQTNTQNEFQIVQVFFNF